MRESGRDVRTSATHPLQVNWLPDHLAPGVGLTFAPGKQSRSLEGFYWERDLDADLGALVNRHGAHVLVTLMEAHELAALGIPDLIARARHFKLSAIHFPIEDVSAPPEIGPVDDLLAHLEAHLAAARRVVIHCVGGMGRTGTIAACLLVRRGLSANEATRIVRAVRCTRFPEGPAQGPFLRRYERSRRAATTAPIRRIHVPDSTTKPDAAPTLPWSLLAALTAAPAAAAPAPGAGQVGERLAAIEAAVRRDPAAAFRTDAAGTVTLTAAGVQYAAGRFETPTLAELADRARTTPATVAGHLRFSIVRGDHACTDIGALQASAPPHTLFQAASQFNCLEAPGPSIVPIATYPSDPTQGPRASVSAFAGTFVRHYFAPRPDGTRFVQTDRDGIDLLRDALPATAGRVQRGYLSAHEIPNPAAAAAALESGFEQLRVGLHADIEVSLGANWGGGVAAPAPRIAQVFTSTIALGSYSGGTDTSTPAFAAITRQLLRAAYLGTLLGAVVLRQERVVLTLIGGGVFGNPHRAIWEAIHWAMAEVECIAPRDLDVVVNAREAPVGDIELGHVRATGGVYLERFAPSARRH